MQPNASLIKLQAVDSSAQLQQYIESPLLEQDEVEINTAAWLKPNYVQRIFYDADTIT